VTYEQFLALFLLIPIAFWIWLSRNHISRRLVALLAALSLLALVYTGPWDNLIVSQGVWSYHPRQIAGVVIGRVPLEEYVFYVLQVTLTGLIAAALLTARRRP